MTGQVIASNRRLVASCPEIGVLLVDITIEFGELGSHRGEMIRFSSHDIRDLDNVGDRCGRIELMPGLPALH